VSREVAPEDIDGEFVARRAATAHTVQVDGEAVLLNEGRLHLLNATGALVWACFDGQGTIAEIAADISEGLGVPYENVFEDTLSVARDLGEEGLLASVSPAERAQVEHTTGDSTETDPRFLDEPPNP
jgi:Coenzyme PQQ synthesis protein D (PqqD)